MARLIRWLCLVAFLSLNASCVRAPLKGWENALRPARAPELVDDLPLVPLFDALEQQIKLIEGAPNYQKFYFGERVIPKEEYLKGLRRFVELGRTSPTSEDFYKRVREEFDFYEVYGQKSWGDAFISSYYEPVLDGSTRKTKQFSTPLYRTPPDLLELNLTPFDDKFKDERRYRARLSENKVVPYYSRAEIDEGGALSRKRLELCWVDPIDAFFLHVQGSGTIRFRDGKELRVGYAERNGQKYESVGKFLKDRLPPDQINLHTIEAYLRSIPVEEAQKFLNLNPSYVFFKILETKPLTTIGMPVTDGRTVATDPKTSPKGALAFLVSTKPRFEMPESVEPKEWIPFSRFVLDQDTGGGINGSGRVDLYWGTGAQAKQSAGVMKQTGKLYYLAPKQVKTELP